MNKRVVILVILLLAVGAGVVYWRGRKGTAPGDSAAAPKPSPSIAAKATIAAPGRVEPVSEEIKLNAEINGRLKAVLVEEGDRVFAGQTIAVLEDSDYRARVASAEAQLAQKEAELRRVVNGSRDQERREALAAIKEAEATMANAKSEMERRRSLYSSGDIPREEAERAERQYQVARARFDAASERHSFVDAVAREEDVARANAEIALARARLEEARAMLAKTVIRSPLSGRILRKHLKTGESVLGSTTGQSQPIVTLADASILRVRIDVDETDIGRVQLGQRVYVTADAYPNQKFWGRVVRIGQILGKKNLRTDEPTEKVDTKILETLVELEPGSELKLGLRVDAFIQTE